MNQNLIIVGAGTYGLVAKELAESMGCFEKIVFLDDKAQTTPNGVEVVGRVLDMERVVPAYGHVIVAIGNAEIRLRLLQKLAEELPCRIATLISPKAYVSPSVRKKRVMRQDGKHLPRVCVGR